VTTPIETARDIVRRADAVAVLTGAGISHESGVPTFRGADGLWRSHRAQDPATPDAFARDPKLVWEWYDWRRGLIAPLEPNPGHLALARWEPEVGDFSLITQNVDGLHAKAGSRALAELHGNLWWIRCTACSRMREDRRASLPELPPVCDACGALERPHVVWFGESLDSAVLEGAAQAAARCDVMLVVGTSGVVQPAAGLASVAARSGAKVIEVNVERTPLSDIVDVTVLGKSGEVLPDLLGD